MKKAINPNLLKGAEKLKKYTGKELLALSLGENDKWGENYKMEMNRRLLVSIKSLNYNINSLKKSMTASSWIMSFMTFLILVFTIVYVFMK